MPASNFFGAIQAGLGFQQQQEQNKLLRQQQFLQLDDQRKGAMFQDARTVNSFLKSGQPEQALNVLSNRTSLLEQMGGDAQDTREIADFIARGDIQGATNLLDSVDQAGVQGGFLKDLESERRKLEGKRPALSEAEKNFTRLTGLRQQLSSAEKSGDSRSISAAQKQLEDFQQLSGKFGETAQQKSTIKVSEAANKELSKQAAIASKDAFDGLKNVRRSIGNMTDAIRAIDKGANTGPVISKLPSFRESSIELDNIRGKMGLDIVGATTFGALSESELKFALDVALPDNMEPPALRDWLNRKRDAQKKLGKELMRAATFLGKPGNTISKYIESETQAGRLSFEPAEDQTPAGKTFNFDAQGNLIQ